MKNSGFYTWPYNKTVDKINDYGIFNLHFKLRKIYASLLQQAIIRKKVNLQVKG